MKSFLHFTEEVNLASGLSIVGKINIYGMDHKLYISNHATEVRDRNQSKSFAPPCSDSDKIASPDSCIQCLSRTCQVLDNQLCCHHLWHSLSMSYRFHSLPVKSSSHRKR